MRLLAAALSLCFATPAFATTLDQPIIGGTPATPGQFPNVVLVEVQGGRCSGTLIASEWVLTAAHCVSPTVLGLPSQGAVTATVRVHFDTTDIRQSPGRTVTAVATFPDPGFDMNALGSHDAGLIQLATPVTDIPPASVNQSASVAPVGTAMTLVGFGMTATGGAGPSGTQNYVAQTSVACGVQGSDANLLCFDQTGGRGLCEGDSGGPVFATVDGKQVEVGVTTFVDPSCTRFGAATRTDAEQGFILGRVPVIPCDDCSVDSGGGGGGCDATGGRASMALVWIGAVALLLRHRRRVTGGFDA